MKLGPGFITQKEYEKWVEYLMKKVPEEQLRRVYEITRTEEGESAFFATEHFGFGMWIRNLLRKGGLIDTLELDIIWFDLIKEAVERFVESRRE